MNNFKKVAFRFLFIVAFNTLHPILFLKRQLALINAKHLNIKPVVKPVGKISVVIVTYNALEYIKKCIDSLEKYRPSDCEVIVVDNASDQETVVYLEQKRNEGIINKLHLSKENYHYIKGNNVGASLVSEDSKYILLLNSDIEFLHPDWFLVMQNLIEPTSIVSLGVADKPLFRPDGWCFLVDRNTFQKLGGLNEYFKMDWGITEFTGKALRAGVPVKSVINPDKYIIHYGGKSVKINNRRKFNRMTTSQIVDLFRGTKVQLFRI